MTKTEFVTWRRKMHITQAAAAVALGVKTGTIKAWEQGRHPIPKPIEMLTAILSNKLEETS